MYAYVRGAKKDSKRAFEYYSISAANGEMRAICELGGFYYDGSGVDRDLKKAYECFLSAAEMGDSKA